MDTIILHRSRTRIWDNDTYTLAPGSVTGSNQRAPLVALGRGGADHLELSEAPRRALVMMLTGLPTSLTPGYRCEIRDSETDAILEVWWERAL